MGNARFWPLTWHQRRAWAGFLFILPTWGFWLIWTAMPTISSIALSFTRWNMIHAPVWIGIQNYRSLLQDSLFFLSFRNSLIYVVVFTPIGILLALIVAILINETVRLREYFRISYFLPVVTSLAAVSVLWTWLYQPSAGLINSALALVSITGPDWLDSPDTALLSVGIMDVWKGLGFTIVLFLAGLQTIPTSLYEACQIDGASGLQRVWFITLPLLRPVALFVSVTGIAAAFQVFVQIYIMTQGGPAYASSVLAYYLYEVAFVNLRMGYATAIAMIIFLLVLAVTVFQLRLFRYGEVD